MDPTLRQIANLYTENLSTHGPQSKAVGWRTPESQELRFQKLSSVIADTGPITVNDYGCGYGAHLEYLTKRGIEVTEYNGYDISGDMLDGAAGQLSWFKGRLNLVQSAELSTQADYSFVSGTFNVRFQADDAQWAEFIRKKLIDLNRWSTRGYAFNQLSVYVDWKEPHLFYGDPCVWFDFVKRELSRKVSLLHDYPLYEWTMTVVK